MQVLWHDQALIDAALLSLRIAAASASIACVVGAIAGFALARFGRFRGRGSVRRRAGSAAGDAGSDHRIVAFAAVRDLEQVTGWPAGRGAGTVTVAHASVSVAYVAVVVRARLADAGIELEQAAMDLYAPPWKAFVLDHAAADGASVGVRLAAGVHLVDG